VNWLLTPTSVSKPFKWSIRTLPRSQHDISNFNHSGRPLTLYCASEPVAIAPRKRIGIHSIHFFFTFLTDGNRGFRAAPGTLRRNKTNRIQNVLIAMAHHSLTIDPAIIPVYVSSWTVGPFKLIAREIASAPLCILAIYTSLQCQRRKIWSAPFQNGRNVLVLPPVLIRYNITSVNRQVSFETRISPLSVTVVY
jgi:hypothetical protein